MEQDLPFTTADLDAVVSLAFEHVAGTLIEPAEGPSDNLDGLCATVDVTGPWECRVVVCLDMAFAGTLAERMLDTDDPTEADIADAIGEMANVVGGSVKGMTPREGCGLTLPVVSAVAPVAVGGLTRVYAAGDRRAVVTVAPL